MAERTRSYGIKLTADASGVKVAFADGEKGVLNLIEAFSRLKKQTAESEKGFASAQAEVKRLAVELKAAQAAADSGAPAGAKGIKALEKDFSDAVKAAGKAKAEFLSQREATEGLRRQLDGLGVSTSNLAAEQIKLKAAVAGANAEQQRLASIKGPAAPTGAIAGMGQLKAGAAGAAGELGKTAVSAKQMEQALRGVPAQFTDIFTSLAAGQNPLQVFLQQGGQLKDMFGGIGPAARAVGGQILALVNPYTLTAGAVAGLTAVYLAGQKEASEFAKAIILSGNAAGTSVGALQAISASVAQATGATQGRAAEVLTGMVAGGKIAADQLDAVAQAAIAMERATGKAAEETAKEFEGLGKAPVQAALKLNESYHFLTASIFEQIKALEEQGRTSEAARVATDALAETEIKRAKAVVENLGLVDEALKTATDLWKHFWDAAKGIGREDSIETELKKAKEDLKQATEAGDTEEIARLQSLIKLRQIAVDAKKKETEDQAELNKQRDLAVGFIEKSATAEEAAATKANKAMLEQLAGWRALVAEKEKDHPGWLDSPEGLAALGRVKAKLAEITTELNKTAIAAETRLKEALVGAMQKGREEADKLKEEIKDLQAEAAKVAAGLSGAGVKAQERRDRAPTTEEADLKATQQSIKDADRAGNKELAERLRLELDGKQAAAEASRQRKEDAIDARNAAEAEAAIEESRRAAVFAANAAIDAKSTGDVDRARAAQEWAKQAAEQAKAAEESASKIKDDALAAPLFDQVQKAQVEALNAQAAAKQAQLKEIEDRSEAQAKALAQLEERVAALKAGAVVPIDADTSKARAAVDAFKAALGEPVTLQVNALVNRVDQQAGQGTAPLNKIIQDATGGTPAPGASTGGGAGGLSTSTVQVNADATQAASAVKEAIPDQKTVVIKTVVDGVPTFSDQVSSDLLNIPGRAWGGPLPGWAPHDRADNMIYRGTPGEWVVQLPAVRYYGDDFMRRLNSMQLPRYAHGGMLGGISAQASLPATSLAERLPLGAMAQALEGANPMSGLKPALFNFPGFGEIPVHVTPAVEQQIGRLIDQHFNRAALSAGRRKSGGRS